MPRYEVLIKVRARDFSWTEEIEAENQEDAENDAMEVFEGTSVNDLQCFLASQFAIVGCRVVREVEDKKEDGS